MIQGPKEAIHPNSTLFSINIKKLYPFQFWLLYMCHVFMNSLLNPEVDITNKMVSEVEWIKTPLMEIYNTPIFDKPKDRLCLWKDGDILQSPK